MAVNGGHVGTKKGPNWGHVTKNAKRDPKDEPKNPQKRSETSPRNYKPLSCRFKISHWHFLTIFHRAKSAQSKIFFHREDLEGWPCFGNGPNTVSESTVSDTELSEFFGAHWVPGSELSEFLSAYYLCAKANSPSFFAELTEFALKLSEFSNSIPPVS